MILYRLTSIYGNLVTALPVEPRLSRRLLAELVGTAVLLFAIAPSSASALIGPQLLGAGLAIVLVRAHYPSVVGKAVDAVIPHGGGTKHPLIQAGGSRSDAVAITGRRND